MQRGLSIRGCPSVAHHRRRRRTPGMYASPSDLGLLEMGPSGTPSLILRLLYRPLSRGDDAFPEAGQRKGSHSFPIAPPPSSRSRGPCLRFGVLTRGTIETLLACELEGEVAIIDPDRATVLACYIVTLVEVETRAASIAHGRGIFVSNFPADDACHVGGH
jgi:hypothetical protein